MDDDDYGLVLTLPNGLVVGSHSTVSIDAAVNACRLHFVHRDMIIDMADAVCVDNESG